MTDKPKVPANPALVEWPRDEWGFTSALRQELLRVASAIRGSDEKQKLFLGTLGIAAQHAQARFERDKTDLQAEVQAEADRIERVNRTGRVYGRAVSDEAAAG